MLHRLSLAGVEHEVEVHFPEAAGDVVRALVAAAPGANVPVRLRPVDRPGTVVDTGDVRLIAAALSHSKPTLGWRVEEPDGWRLLPDRLEELGVHGPDRATLQHDGRVRVGGRTVDLEQAAVPRPGQSAAVVMDTRWCDGALALAEGVDLLAGRRISPRRARPHPTSTSRSPRTSTGSRSRLGPDRVVPPVPLWEWVRKEHADLRNRADVSQIGPPHRPVSGTTSSIGDMMSTQPSRAVVAGGGLGGLVASLELARAGWAVTLVDGRAELGGRARSTRVDGYHLDLGPHALYRAGATQRTLDRLRVRVGGGAVPPGALAFAVDGRVVPGPFGGRGLVDSSLLSLGDRLELGRLLAGLRAWRRDPTLARTTVAEALDERISRPAVRRLVEAVVRLTTYAADPARQAADAALGQLALGLRGVRYLDGGWSSLVAALERAATAGGVDVVRGDAVVTVQHDERVRAVTLRSGRRIETDAAVLAVGGPRETARLVDVPRVAERWRTDATSVRAACLTVALERVPRPEVTYAIGWDAPTYLSAHSAYADQAPHGGAVFHAAHYLGVEPANPDAHRAELEAQLSLAQPGWREVAVHVRFLPEMTVSHDLPTAATGGLSSRPGPLVDEVAGLAVVGDWVGGEGLLADAATASAVAAARGLGAGSPRRARVPVP